MYYDAMKIVSSGDIIVTCSSQTVTGFKKIPNSCIVIFTIAAKTKTISLEVDGFA